VAGSDKYKLLYNPDPERLIRVLVANRKDEVRRISASRRRTAPQMSGIKRIRAPKVS
jgi:hypothetical protein